MCVGNGTAQEGVPFFLCIFGKKEPFTSESELSRFIK